MSTGFVGAPEAEDILSVTDSSTLEKMIRDLAREKRLSDLVSKLNRQSKADERSVRQQARAALERLGFVDVT
jgi:hypothetical protein